MDNRLEVSIENGTKIIVRVLDIIDSNVFNKSFIIYNVEGEEETIFGSILVETDDSYTFETVTNPEEIDYINSEINRVAREQRLIQ